MVQRRSGVIVVWAATLAVGGVACGGDATGREPGDPPQPAPSYVGADACAACHPTQAARWRGSDHDLAMQPPGPDSVLGAFSGAPVRFSGGVARFVIRDGRYLVQVQSATGRDEYEVAYTFGVDPLQQYLLRTEGGRLQVFALAWDALGAGRGGRPALVFAARGR